MAAAKLIGRSARTATNSCYRRTRIFSAYIARITTLRPMEREQWRGHRILNGWRRFVERYDQTTISSLTPELRSQLSGRWLHRFFQANPIIRP